MDYLTCVHVLFIVVFFFWFLFFVFQIENFQFRCIWLLPYPLNIENPSSYRDTFTARWTGHRFNKNTILFTMY